MSFSKLPAIRQQLLSALTFGRFFSVCYSRAEKIPAGGTLPACMDGVSLYLEKNFNKMI